MTASIPAAEDVNPSPEEVQSALFAYLVMQQSNMAMMLMGKTPNPQTGQAMLDLEAAKMFIDQLEMLEAKTKGNLNGEESNLLKRTLMTLRMSFVEAANAPEKNLTAKNAENAEKEPDAKIEPAPSGAAAEDEEHRKKFTKKY
jgi:hypothetical protein